MKDSGHARRVSLLAISGSLRRGSYNTKLINECRRRAPASAIVTTFDLGGIPLFNQDLEERLPRVVLEFKQALEACDGVLIATPEYNHSVSGVLKNAIDWASRPAGHNSFANKPVAIVSASVGRLGGIRAQLHLREILFSLAAQVVSKPEVLLASAEMQFDETGTVADPVTIRLLQELLLNLVALCQGRLEAMLPVRTS